PGAASRESAALPRAVEPARRHDSAAGRAKLVQLPQGRPAARLSVLRGDRAQPVRAVPGLLALARAGVRRPARHKPGREPGALRPAALRAAGRDAGRRPVVHGAMVRAGAYGGSRTAGRAAGLARERPGAGARLAALVHLRFTIGSFGLLMRS